MKYIIEKRNYIILVIIIVLIGWILLIDNKPFVKTFEFGDNMVTIVINQKINKKNVADKINEIYKSDDVNTATEKVVDYFKRKKISKYLLNENGNIVAGESNKKYYYIGLYKPRSDEVYKIVKLKNKALYTSNSDLYESLVVMCNDYSTSKKVSDKISQKDIASGKKYLSKHNCEAVWYEEDDITFSDNFEKYTN